MSNTNQVCVCCEAMDNCPYYDTRRTVCVPVKCADWDDFNTVQGTIDWQHYRIQAAIAAMGIVKDAYNIHDDVERLVQHSVRIADALIEELKKGGEQ